MATSVCPEIIGAEINNSSATAAVPEVIIEACTWPDAAAAEAPSGTDSSPQFDLRAALATTIFCECMWAAGPALEAVRLQQDYFAFFSDDAISTVEGRKIAADWVWYATVPHPVIAIIAWCVGQRHCFRPGVGLHTWSRRYGIASAVYLLLFPTVGQGFALWCLKLCMWSMVSIKLSDLGYRWVARIVLASVYWSVITLWATGILWYLVGTVWTSSLFDFLALMLLLGLLGMLIGVVCMLYSGLRGACSSSAVVRRSAGWVVLTGVAAALGLVTWVINIPGDGSLLGDLIPHTADLILDNICVVVFSGLTGPPGMRRLALDAFTHINNLTDAELQEHYEHFLDYVQEAGIRWVRFRYLRQLVAEGRIMPRCQEVPASETVLGRESLPSNRAACWQGRVGTRRWVTSHPWLSKAHPDPEGKKLRLLINQLDALGAEGDDAIFLDFMSLPQHDNQAEELRRLEREDKWPNPGEHPAVRTLEEEACFQRALSAMETLYSIANIPVVVLPMEQEVDAGKKYISRGWCLLEFSLALSFNTIANADASPEVHQLKEMVTDAGGTTVDVFCKAFERCHFTSSGDKDVVLRLFEQTLRKSN